MGVLYFGSSFNPNHDYKGKIFHLGFQLIRYGASQDFTIQQYYFVN